MRYSGSDRPDLDWSQVRETVKLLAVSAAQLEGGMKMGDESVSVLTESFTRMFDELNAIASVLTGIEPTPERDQALRYCANAQSQINESIVAFQFYDRLQQRLQHVGVGLRALSAIIESPDRLYNPNEWLKLQNDIRGRYTMESEKVMFDAIHDGKSIDEALALSLEPSKQVDDEDDVELF